MVEEHGLLGRALLKGRTDFAATRTVDTLVIGGGVAGFRAALAAAAHGSVLLVTKDSFRESNTQYAQGGVAAVLGAGDTYSAHEEDTIKVGQGLCRSSAVRVVVEEGPQRIRELIDWGGEFDRVEGELHLSLEGGHSHHRVVHAHGDATGSELQVTLLRRVVADSRIERLEYAFATDLLTDEGRCVGALVALRGLEPAVLLARSTILCTGGAGQIYRETTNPRIATGDGIAMAWRAGAELLDMEFFQFHPTTLYVAGSSRRLITEAVRGEGGHLVDAEGERFMFRYHPDGELAPRDIVSRAIVQHLAITEESCVYLDLSHMADGLAERFPGLVKLCALYELDATKDRIPVHPSAHYMVGGVDTDLFGQTCVPGLYAAGEVTMTGLHGANRLASNSLIEGLVFGRRAGEHAGATGGRVPRSVHLKAVTDADRSPEYINVEDMVNSVKSLMWRHVGIARTRDGLERAARQLKAWRRYVMGVCFSSPDGFELVNLLTTAGLVADAAAWRCESRGTHFRNDFPEHDDQRFRVHSVQGLEGEILGREL